MIKIYFIAMLILTIGNLYSHCVYSDQLDDNIVRVVITPAGQPKNGYSRRGYETEVIELALIKTLDEGAYDLDFSLREKNTLRELALMRSHQFPNYIRTFAIDENLLNDPNMIYIEFPVMRGAHGYRVCIVHPETKALLDKSTSTDYFLSLNFIQGTGWLDTTLMIDAGFKVFGARQHSNILKMVARRRADIYCQSAVEVLGDRRVAQLNRYGLVVDEKFILTYPLPRYFFANVRDKKMMDRIARGLQIAYDDGSFLKLWETYHLQALTRAKAKNRIFIEIPNPVIKKINPSIQHYMYNLKKQKTLDVDASTQIQAH